jgi:hypothetical protein
MRVNEFREGRLNLAITVVLNAINIRFAQILIFARVRFKNYMLSSALSASVGGANPTGILNKNILDYRKNVIA